MKNLNMDVYGVEAMSKQEMQKENGGVIPVALKYAVAGAIYVWDNWDDIKEGWAEGWAEGKRGAGAGRSF